MTYRVSILIGYLPADEEGFQFPIWGAVSGPISKSRMLKLRAMLNKAGEQCKVEEVIPE